jgi:hypothetical protein
MLNAGLAFGTYLAYRLPPTLSCSISVIYSGYIVCTATYSSQDMKHRVLVVPDTGIEAIAFHYRSAAPTLALPIQFIVTSRLAKHVRLGHIALQ